MLQYIYHYVFIFHFNLRNSFDYVTSNIFLLPSIIYDVQYHLCMNINNLGKKINFINLI